MAASQIRTLYSKLAAQTVTLTREAGGSVAVAALDLHQLRPVQAADVPIRLLLPYSSYTEMRTAHFMSLGATGGLVKPRWNIVDLLLLQAGNLSTLAEVAPDLVRYQGAYQDMLRGFRTFGTSGAGVTLQEWEFYPGVYDWPIHSDQVWHGVMVVLRVDEILSGV